MKIAILALVAGACVANVARAQQDSAKPRIRMASGEVSISKTLVVRDDETDQKIVGAEVRDLLTGAVSYTDSNGTAVLNGMKLTAGKYNVLVRNTGYQPASLTIDGNDAPVVMLTRALATPQTSAIALAPVTTTAKALTPTMQAFEDRRKRIPEGRFITEAEIRQADKNNVTFKALLLSRDIRTWSRGCKEQPRIYLDGILQATSRDFGIQDVEAVEFYSAVSAPFGFAGQSNCNVLLVWSREK